MTEIFGTVGHMSALQECARAVVIFAYGLALVRLVGRRVFGKWAALDIIVSIMVGSNLSRALTGQSNMAGTILATTLIMALHWLLSHASARFPVLARILEGSPVELGRGGSLERKALHHHAVSQADLDEALRQVNLDEVSASKRIVLEPSGKINVLKG